MLQFVRIAALFVFLGACTEENALQENDSSNLREGGISKDERLLIEAANSDIFASESKDSFVVQTAELSTGSIKTKHVEVNFNSDAFVLKNNQSLAVVTGEIAQQPEDLGGAFDELYRGLSLTNTIRYKSGVSVAFITEDGPVKLSKEIEVCHKIALDEGESAKVVFLNLEQKYSLKSDSQVRLDSEQRVCTFTDSLNGAFFFLGFTENQTGGSDSSDTDSGSGSDTDSSTGGSADVDTDSGSGSDIDSSTGGSTDVDTDSGSGSDIDSSTGGSTDVDTTPPSGASLTINSGETATNSPKLDLVFAATDATEMAFGVATDCSGLTNFISYKTNESGYAVNVGSDLKTTISVSVLYKDDAGNKSGCVTKSIIYDKEPPTSADFQINAGGSYSNEESLDLSFVATGATQMAFGISSDCSDLGAWVDYTTSVSGVGSFDLNHDADVTVGVKFKDALGNETACITKTIQVDRVPPNDPTLSIQGGAEGTANTTLALSISSTGADEMAITEGAQCSSESSWISNSNSYNLILGSTPNNGDTVSVSVQTRDLSGNITSCVADTIIFDTKYGDLTDDDNTALGFAGGTHKGTVWDSSNNRLKLIKTGVPSTRNLASTWTPQWNQLGAYYPLDGDTNDHSGNGHHATLENGAATNNSEVQVGSHSVSLNGGSTQFIEILHHEDLKPTNLTVSIWANLDNWGSGSNQSLISNHEVGGYAIYSTHDRHLYTWVYTPRFTGRTNSSCNVDMGGISGIVDGQWAHIALTYDGVTQYCYINGVLVGTVENPELDESKYEDAAPHPSNATVIGAEANGTSASANYLTGKVDDVAVWKTALTADEIALIYNVQAEKFFNNNSTLDSSWAPQYTDLVFHQSFENDNWDGGTSTGSPSFSNATVKVGSYAASLNGTNSYVSWTGITNLPQNDDVRSFSFWMNVPSFGTDFEQPLVSYGDESGCGTDFSIYAQEGAIGMRLGCARLITPKNILATDTWYHVVASFGNSGGTDTNSIKIYINGEEQTLSYENGINSTIDTTTLTLKIGRDNQAAQNHFLDGYLDELGIWKSVLTAEDAQIIYDWQKAHFSGSYTSRVIDTGDANSSWSAIEWKTTLPYGKELATTSETSSGYSALGSNDLGDGLLRLYHFDETTADSVSGSDFEDEKSAEHLITTASGITYDQPGVFSRSFSMNGAGNLSDSNTGLPTGSAARTYSFWAYIETVPNAAATFFYQGDFDAAANAFGFQVQSGRTQIKVITMDAGNEHVINYNVDRLRWIHFVVTYDGTNSAVYADGVLLESTAKSWSTAASGSFLIGAASITADNLRRFTGKMDEFAVWDRALSAEEVGFLYQRGVNRTKLQVRSCTVSDCSDNPTWKGPDNTAVSYFSEFYNRTNNDSSLESLATYPIMTFDNFNTPAMSVDNNRYFQYRVILESDVFSTSPDVESVIARP